MEQLILQIIINGLLLALLYLLVALGLTLLFSIMEILNFAHGEMLMLGAFVTYYITDRIRPTGSPLINFILAFILAILVVAVIGIFIERAFFRPLKGRVLEMLIMSVGLSVVLQSGGYMTFGILDKGVTSPMSGILNIFGASLPLTRLLVMIGSVVLVSLLFYVVHRTKLGMAMRAVEQDSETAAMLGIRINRVLAYAFAIASGLAAAGGVLVAPVFVITPVMGTVYLLKAFVVIILGGAGSVIGCVAGAFFLGFIDSLTGTLFGEHIAYGTGFALIIAILLLKPEGLAGHAQR